MYYVGDWQRRQRDTYFEFELQVALGVTDLGEMDMEAYMIPNMETKKRLNEFTVRL